MAEWRPSPEDIRQGQEAYIRYLGGVSILNSPYNPADEFLMAQVAEEDPLSAVLHAENVMYEGLRGVIQAANDPEHRTWSAAQTRFDTALPHMLLITDSTFEQFGARIRNINPGLDGFRPAPFLIHKTYQNLCHANKNRLHTLELIYPMNAAVVFRSILQGRTIASVKAS